MAKKYRVSFEGFSYVLADSEEEAIASFTDDDFIYLEQTKIEAEEVEEFEVRYDPV